MLGSGMNMINYNICRIYKMLKILEGFCMKKLLPSVGTLKEILREYFDCELGTIWMELHLNEMD